LRRDLASPLLVALLAAATLAPKLWLERRSAHIDIARLDADVATRLQASGFRTAIDLETPGTAVRAWRRDCRVFVRNGDRARELASVFRLDATAYGPVFYGHWDKWSTRLPPWPSIVERHAQEAAKRIGISFARPPVLAMARSSQCAFPGTALAGLEAYATLRGEETGVDPVTGRK
jgi:hypothetical protein